MTKTSKREAAQQIDIDKIRLEASIIPKVKKVFSHLAQDVEALYVTTGAVPAQELSQNYFPEFTKEIRDAMRKSIKFFGFDLRDTLEKKHAIFFDVEHRREAFDLCFKKLAKIDDPNLNSKLNDINNDFMREVTIFVANQSEDQARFVTDTNAKEILSALRDEEEKFRQDLQERASQISDLESQEITPAIRQQIDRAKTQLAASQADARNIVGKNVRANLLDRSDARSDLIASQNVGLAESWARQTEGKLVNDAQLADATGATAKVVKTWIAILDTKTRLSHAEADFQQVDIDASFTVRGESLLYPRDPTGSPGNIINCRCVSHQEVELS